AEDCLLDGRLCLDRLAVTGADVRIGASEAEDEPPAEEPPAAGGLPDVDLPFPMEIREVSVNDAAVYLDDGTRLAWQSFTTGAIAETDTIKVQPTRLAGLRVTLPLTPGAMLALSASEHDGPVVNA